MAKDVRTHIPNTNIFRSGNRLFSFSDEEDANENPVTTNNNIAHSNAEISHTDDDEYAMATQKFEVKRYVFFHQNARKGSSKIF